MPVVQLAPHRPYRTLAVTALAAAGALAWKMHKPAAAPPVQVVCAIPAIDPAPPPPSPHFAVPPPGDPYPRPELADKRYFTVDAELVATPRAMPGCGTFVTESLMQFHPVQSNGADLRVLVPCAEMPRPMYSHDAGNAGVLRLDGVYRLSLVPATDVPDGKNDTLWRADRIDDVYAYPVTHYAR